MVQDSKKDETQDADLAAHQLNAEVALMEATATSTQQAPEQIAASSLKVAQLQEKTRNLRETIASGRRSLQQKQEEQSPAERKMNDKVAAKKMKKCVTCDDRNGDKPEAASSEKERPATSAAAPKPNKNESKLAAELKVRLSGPPKYVLREQVEGLFEVLVQLTVNNPQLWARAHQLIMKNPKLQRLDLLANPPRQQGGTQPAPQGGRQATGVSNKQRVNSEPTTCSAKARRESELSSTSSCFSQRDARDTAAGNAEPNTKKKRRRQREERANKNRAKNDGKTLASEQKTLTDYINKIVHEYFGEQQQERAVELEFNGGVGDLEAYAQRLVQAGIGRIVEEEIHVNRKNNRQAFVAMCNDREGTERDGIILQPVARRYAFDGDTVRAFVLNAGVAPGNAPAAKSDAGGGGAAESATDESSTLRGGKDNSFSLADDEEDAYSPGESDVDANELDTSMPMAPDNCPKAFVIAIVRQTELRQIIGTISFKNPSKLHDDRMYYKLKPHDMRVPMAFVAVDSCAAHATEENKKDVCGFLYVAHVLETNVCGYCIAELVQPVGKVGNLEAEVKAILLHNNLKDIRPYEQRFNDMYAQPDAAFVAADHPNREDLREKCIFTIDPLTARDLDDAMSIERISDDEVEVGVHISDVSHYLQENCELDNIVKDRATSIYLVNEVIHMLPQPLCFKCSLLPGEEKFAFSVFWRMTIEGELVAPPRFTRSVIRSCSQFAYEHAQKIIDNPDEQFNSDDDFPTICNGFTANDIVERVRLLHSIAQCMRNKRYENGALSINNPKLRFTLDPATGEPASYSVDGRQEANFLIEEFMLLANQSVARFIYDHFPNISILRNHAPPLSKSMKAVREKLNNFGIDFDYSSSKAVYESMQRICRESRDPAAMDACLNTLLTKPMARAQYFCSEGKTEESQLWHYALSIPIYTHFTSPIRRYPDILVHRLLAAALGISAPPTRTVDELHVMAKVCNDQKYNAKNAGDESNMLFFKRYIEIKQSLTLRAVVTEIFQHLMNVTTIETGHSISIQYKMQKVVVNTANAPACILISEKNSNIGPIKLQMFSTVDVKLVVWDNKLCGLFASPDPKQRQLNYATKKSKETNNNGNDEARKSRHNSQSNGHNHNEKPTTSKKQGKAQGVSKPQRIYAVSADVQ